ncbi:MAG: phage terminase large subunit, partial [Verrucomicrobiaceae bacterium]|nr:phage terminase large subunit [Verrucomicrobiaceae bacterium]
VVGLVIGQRGADFYVIDCIRERMAITETLPAILNTANKYRPVAVVIEDKANGPAAIAMLKSKVAGIIAINPQGGKYSRASAISPLVEAGNVFLPERSRWGSAFVEEFAAFPNAAHDDQVDALSQGLSWLRSRPPIATSAAVSYGQGLAI